jgi:hypothetical protein
MQFVCDAPGGTAWFRIETDAEAEAESVAMRHAVADYFRRAAAEARATYQAGEGLERDIGLKAHIARTMPQFMTLRADDGEALATAMLPPSAAQDIPFRIIIVGPGNADPYPQHADAIAALAAALDVNLPRDRCYPYG